MSAPPPPRLRPPARCKEKRRSRCIPAAPGPPPSAAPLPGQAPRAPAPDAESAAAAATLTGSRLAAGSLGRAARSPRRRAPPPPRPAPGPLPPRLRAAASFSSWRCVCASDAEARTRSPEPRPPRAPALPAPPLGVPRRPQAARPLARSAAAPGRLEQGEWAGDAERPAVQLPPARSFGPRITVTQPGALGAGIADLESRPGNFRNPRPVRVNCAASSSAVNNRLKYPESVS